MRYFTFFQLFGRAAHALRARSSGCSVVRFAPCFAPPSAHLPSLTLRYSTLVKAPFTRRNLSLFLYICLLLPIFALAQPTEYPRYDFVWKHGYGSYYNHPEWGAFTYDFNTEPFEIQQQYSPVDLFDMTGNISNFSGDFMCYSNALHILNGNDSIVENGDSICLDTASYLITQNFEALNFSQGTFFLPTLIDSVFYCINAEGSYDFGNLLGYIHQSYNYYLSKIDMRLNNGAGKVVERDIVLKSDTLEQGKITACRHANGRDWWLLFPKYFSNMCFKILLTPDGFSELEPQSIGTAVPLGIGNNIFSPDGTKFIRMNWAYSDQPANVQIYDFDRCTGLLSNPVFWDDIPALAEGSGVVCSRNSQYLYVFGAYKIWQYDLWANDIHASKKLIATQDGSGNPTPTYFHIAQNTPTGQIYLCTVNGTFNMSVIERPNKEGQASRLLQSAITLPKYTANLPNFANYRLGPIDGSACDTLGIDNMPIAWFNPQLSDTLSEFGYDFLDLSIGEPTTWSWQFGDGSSSTQQEPSHTYAQPGVYEVCLTVSNDNGSYTWCDTLYVGNVSTSDVGNPHSPKVYPNPATDYFLVQFAEPQHNATITLTNALGEVVHQAALQPLVSTIWVKDLVAGVYFYSIEKNEKVLQSGKVVKQ